MKFGAGHGPTRPMSGSTPEYEKLKYCQKIIIWEIKILNCDVLTRQQQYFWNHF
jgi:hypothetical protein